MNAEEHFSNMQAEGLLPGLVARAVIDHGFAMLQHHPPGPTVQACQAIAARCRPQLLGIVRRGDRFHFTRHSPTPIQAAIIAQGGIVAEPIEKPEQDKDHGGND